MRMMLNRRAVLAAAVATTIGLTLQARAQESGEVERFPLIIDYTTDDGTTVHVTADVVVVSNFTTDESGGFHGVLRLRTIGLTGVDDAGATYRGSWTQVFAFNSTVGESQSINETTTVVLAGPGEGNQMLIRIQSHLTVTATGEVAVSFSGPGGV